MTFLIHLPSLTLDREFSITEVRTKSSVAKQRIKFTYRERIRNASSNFCPLPNTQYIVSFRISCSAKRSNFPDVENVTKEIIDTIFPDDCIKVVKGIQMEAEIAEISTNEEKIEVRIYVV